MLCKQVDNLLLNIIPVGEITNGKSAHLSWGLKSRNLIHLLLSFAGCQGHAGCGSTQEKAITENEREEKKTALCALGVGDDNA